MSKFTKKEIAWLKTAATFAALYYATTFIIDHLPVNSPEEEN